MPLGDNERHAVVSYRLEKAESTLIEAKDCGKMGHWTLAANRLYYAAYYACSALLIEKGLQAKTHEGTIGMIGLHFIKTGILHKESGTMLARLLSMRHTGDYDDFIDWEQEDVEPYFQQVEVFLSTIGQLISSS